MQRVKEQIFSPSSIVSQSALTSSFLSVIFIYIFSSVRSVEKIKRQSELFNSALVCVVFFPTKSGDMHPSLIVCWLNFNKFSGWDQIFCFLPLQNYLCSVTLYFAYDRISFVLLDTANMRTHQSDKDTILLSSTVAIAWRCSYTRLGYNVKSFPLYSHLQCQSYLCHVNVCRHVRRPYAIVAFGIALLLVSRPGRPK